MIEEILISIVMPAYNSAKTIRRAIDSIVAQTYRNWELLVVVEKESDIETKQIVSEYAKEDSRIFLVTNENKRGVAGSLNYGFSLARGKYIARMDSDDVSLEKRFEKQLVYMESHSDVTMCGSSCIIVAPEGEQFCQVPTEYESIKASILFQNCIVHPSVMIRRADFLSRNLEYNELCKVEDYELWLRIVSECKVENIKEPLLKYYYDGINNLSSQDKIKDIAYGIINSALIELFKENGLVIPKPLTGYECSLSFGEEKPDIIINVLLFMERIMVANRKRGFCECLELEKVVLKKWNSFLENYYCFQTNYHEICSLLFLDEIFEHSLITTLSKRMDIQPEVVIEIIQNLIDTLSEKVKDLNTVIIYGVGAYCRKFKDYINRYVNVVSYVDKEKQGTFYEGNLIEPPSVILTEKYDSILITSPKYYDEILDTLHGNMGIAKENVFPIHILRFKKNRILHGGANDNN